MPSRTDYLQQAKTYFDMAAMSRDEEMRARWIDRANECLILARAFGDDLPAVSPAGGTSPAPGRQHRPKGDRRE